MPGLALRCSILLIHKRQRWGQLEEKSDPNSSRHLLGFLIRTPQKCALILELRGRVSVVSSLASKQKNYLHIPING